MEHRIILLDVEVQRDFFAAGGSCWNVRSTPVAKKIYELFDWARRSHQSVISTVLRVRVGRLGPLARVPHCVEGTDGERKLSRTVLPSRIDLGLRGTTDLAPDLLDAYQQVIFEKRHTDIFQHARAERLFTEMPPATFVICGAGIAHGIAQAAIGLRRRGFGVVLASDAVLDLGQKSEEMALRRMSAKGVIFAPTSEIAAPRPKEGVRPFRPSVPVGRF